MRWVVAASWPPCKSGLAWGERQAGVLVVFIGLSRLCIGSHRGTTKVARGKQPHRNDPRRAQRAHKAPRLVRASGRWNVPRLQRRAHGETSDARPAARRSRAGCSVTTASRAPSLPSSCLRRASKTCAYKDRSFDDKSCRRAAATAAPTAATGRGRAGALSLLPASESVLVARCVCPTLPVSTMDHRGVVAAPSVGSEWPAASCTTPPRRYGGVALRVARRVRAVGVAGTSRRTASRALCRRGGATRRPRTASCSRRARR